jgi:hypothetical protein
MYNNDQTKALQEHTSEWLSAVKNDNISETVKNKPEDLRNCLRFHEYRYYVHPV